MTSIDIFRFDTYSGQNYSNEDVVREFTAKFGSNFQFNIIAVNDNLIPIGEPVRPWALWNGLTDKLAGVLSQSSDSIRILTGKCPMSMMSRIGEKVNRSQIIANEFRGNWDFYFASEAQIDKSSEHPLTLSEKMVTPGRQPLNVFFCSLNNYTLKDSDLDDIVSQVSGRCGQDLILGSVYTLNSPAGQFDLAPTTDFKKATNFADICRQIRDAYQKIVDHHGIGTKTVLISSGPQPISYMMGSLRKINVHGEALFFEKVGPKYQLTN